MCMQRTDVGEFSIFPDEEIMLDRQCLKLFDEITVEILHNVDVRLFDQKNVNRRHSFASTFRAAKSRRGSTGDVCTLMQQHRGPTASAIRRREAFLVTSTETQRFVDFLSIVASSNWATAIGCAAARAE